VSTYPFQSSFNAGEFSPRLEGRVDTARYANAVKTCKNFVIYPHGGVTRRPGTRFVKETKTSAKKSRLIPFEFSDVQAYALEFGDLYIRIYKDGGNVENPPGTPVEVTTPWTENDLAKLQYIQSADTLYLVHPDFAPRKLTRTSHTAWTLSTIVWTDGPYLEEKTTPTITPSATSGNGITLTASASLFESGHVNALWRIKHGSTWGYVQITAVASATSATADVKKNLGAATASDAQREGAWSTKRGFPSTITFHEQRLFLGGTANNPQTIDGSQNGSYEDMTPGTADNDAVRYTLAANDVNVLRWLAPTRVLLAGTMGGEFRLSGGQNDILTPTTVQAKSETTFGSRAVQPIRVDAATIFVQKSGRKLRELAFVNEDDAYRAPNLSLLAEHLFPAKQSIKEADYQKDPDPIIWCVRSDGPLLGMTYDRAQDVVAWHQHDTEAGSGKFESLAIIPHPDGDSDQVWVLVNRTVGGATKRYVEYFDLKGNVYTAYEQLNTDSALTYDGTKNVALTLSAVSGSSITVTAASSVFASGDVGKEIRAGNGRAEITAFTSGTVVTAKVHSTFASTSIAANGWKLAVFSVTGLSHLDGKTVAVVGDGAVYNNAIVSSGAATLAPAVSAGLIEVGLPYTSTLETLRPEVQLTNGGTSQGRRKRWNEVIVRLYNTLGLKVEGDVLPFRKPGDAMDAPPPLVSDDIRKTNVGWDRAGRLKFEQTYPLPATINGITGTLDVTEG
jgi:hypothetical protein